MESSIFLAKLIGLTLFIMGMVALFTPKQIGKIYREIAREPALIFILGMFSIVIGLSIILVHNVWEASWTLAITLVGWLALLKGIIRVCFPMQLEKAAESFIRAKNSFVYFGLLSVLLGAWLSYTGFMQ